MKSPHPVAKELKISFKENFETLFSTKLLYDNEIKKVVHKISNLVSELLKDNLNAVVTLIQTNPVIREHIFQSEYFGHSNLSGEKYSNPESVVSLILGILNDPKASLIHVMHLQWIVIHDLYDKLENKSAFKNCANKNEIVKKIFFNDLFNPKRRYEIPTDNALTAIFGINRNLFFKNKASRGDVHFPAMKKFLPNENSDFYKMTEKNSLPFVSGPSGHTGSFLLLAKLCDLNPMELNIYALACFAFLTCGGNHSFHEVMIIANILGVPFEIGNYEVSIPESIKSSPLYRELQQFFPEFLPDVRMNKLEQSC